MTSPVSRASTPGNASSNETRTRKSFEVLSVEGMLMTSRPQGKVQAVGSRYFSGICKENKSSVIAFPRPGSALAKGNRCDPWITAICVRRRKSPSVQLRQSPERRPPAPAAPQRFLRERLAPRTHTKHRSRTLRDGRGRLKRLFRQLPSGRGTPGGLWPAPPPVPAPP